MDSLLLLIVRCYLAAEVAKVRITRGGDEVGPGMDSRRKSMAVGPGMLV